MSQNAPSLDELRAVIQQAQRSGDVEPNNPDQGIRVGRNGEIYTPGTAPSDEPLSKTHMGTFAAGTAVRDARDRQFADQKMPQNTRYIDVSGTRGWAYRIRTQMGNDYTLFAYFDGRNYQVQLVEPRLNKKIGIHSGHLYRDGRICLSEDYNSGQPSLEYAYSKSVIWANGVDVVRAGYNFPYSVNNLND